MDTLKFTALARILDSDELGYLHERIRRHKPRKNDKRNRELRGRLGSLVSTAALWRKHHAMAMIRTETARKSICNSCGDKGICPEAYYSEDGCGDYWRKIK